VQRAPAGVQKLDTLAIPAGKLGEKEAAHRSSIQLSAAASRVGTLLANDITADRRLE